MMFILAAPARPTLTRIGWTRADLKFNTIVTVTLRVREKSEKEQDMKRAKCVEMGQ